MTERILRVNQLLKKELGSILLREIVFPDGCLVSISRAEATPNLQQAKIYITVFPADKEKEVMDSLRKKALCAWLPNRNKDCLSARQRSFGKLKKAFAIRVRRPAR